MGNFATWLEGNTQARYKALGGEIFDYVTQMCDNLGNDATPEEIFKKVMHAFSDDIMNLGDPTLERDLVAQIKHLCSSLVGSVSLAH